ncbi:MAG: hypothetical protein O2845_06965, partial [Proteobacteria bacterium]|nr:hypothetical protein [Pseudomonadota bacterium]
MLKTLVAEFTAAVVWGACLLRWRKKRQSYGKWGGRLLTAATKAAGDIRNTLYPMIIIAINEGAQEARERSGRVVCDAPRVAGGPDVL